MKLPWAAWGTLPFKVGMRRVCASHIPRSSSGARIPPTPFGARVCVRGMRWGRDPIRLPKTPLEKNGYALGMRQPHSSLVIWIRPGSRKIPFGARVCVTGMRWGQDPIGLPKPSLEKMDMRRVCASHIPRSSSGSSWNTSRILLESIWSKGMRQGYAPVKPRPQPRQSASRQKTDMRWVCAGHTAR